MHGWVTNGRATALAVGALTTLMAWACGEPNAPAVPTHGVGASQVMNNETPPTPGQRVPLCKETGPVGVYTFQITVVGGTENVDWSLPNGGTISLQIYDPAVPHCVTAWQSLQSGTTSTITIAEINIPTGVELQKIELVTPDGTIFQTITGAGSVTFQASFESAYAAKFYNQAITTPTGKIGDFVWKDLNANGIQDSGEPGIPGVTATLGGTATGTTTTDATGYYLFSNLGAGSYTVTFSALPAGCTPTTTNAGSDPTKDSNGSPATVVLPTNSSVDPTIDYGCVPPLGKLGDFVWSDLNANGIQDAGEPGIAGVTVTLSGAASGTTTTNASGYYLFENLAAGNYVVTVATPTGMSPTLSLVGTNRAVDSNGSPASVTLPTNVSDDRSIDFGFITKQNGCTGTIGYWKNWSGLGTGNQTDLVSPLLPIWLGTAKGKYSVKVTTNVQAVAILDGSESSNGISKLLGQLLAAKLAIASGAGATYIATTIASVDVFLAAHSTSSWSSLTSAEQAQVLAWKDMLARFNQGSLGPPHC